MDQPPDGAIQQVVQLPVSAIAGFSYPFQSLSFLSRSPQLWGCVGIPIAINLVLGVLLYAGLLVPGWGAINQWTASFPDWLAQQVGALPLWASRWLGWLPAVADFLDDGLRGLLAIGLLIVTGLLLVQFGAIFGAPWYGNLAEQVERARTGKLPTRAMTLQNAAQDIGRAIGFQLKKLLLAIGLGLPLFLLNLLPGLGSAIASVAGVALAALLVGLDFLDPSLERRRLGFRSKLGMIARSLPSSATFCLSCLWLISIPLLNLVTVPLCIVAGTLFCCDRILPILEPNLAVSDRQDDA